VSSHDRSLPVRAASFARRSGAIVSVAAWCAIGASGCGGHHRLSRTRAAGKTVVHRLAVGGAPVGLLAYGGSVWVANAQTDQVFRLDEHTGAVIARVRVGHTPLRLAGVAGRVFATNWGNRTMSVISTTGAGRAATVPVAPQPEGITPFGPSLWLVSESTGDLVRVSDSGHPLSRVHVGRQPRQVTVAGSDLWVSVFADDAVAEVNPQTGRLVARVKTCAGPQGLASASGQLWVACTTTGELIDIDPRSRTVVRRVPYQAADAVSVAGSSLLVTSDAGPAMAVLDPRTGTLSDRKRLSNGFIADANADVVAAGGSVWVSSPDEGVVYRIDRVVP
jgi:YVTN family beta-propeller protein